MAQAHSTHSVMTDILTLREAAHLLKLSERTVWEMIQSEHLPARKLGGQWRLSRRQLIDHIERTTSAAQG